MKRIRIHDSGLNCIQLISVVVLPSAAWPLPFVASQAMDSQKPFKQSFSNAMHERQPGALAPHRQRHITDT